MRDQQVDWPMACASWHFCSCPPWLSVQRFDSSGHEVDIHFTKQNYNDQFAILGKSKVSLCIIEVTRSDVMSGAPLLCGAEL